MNIPMKKPTKPSTTRIGNVLILQAAEHNLPRDDGGGNDEAENHVAEIATEEPVAVLALDALGETVAGIGDGLAVRLVDNDAAAVAIDEGVDGAFASRQAGKASLGLLAGPLQRQRLAGLIEMDEPLHRERQRRRGEGAPFLARETPIVDVVGERRRNALRRMEQRNDGAALGSRPTELHAAT